MNTLSQETIDHILSFLTSKADLCRSSLVNNRFLGQCRRQLFYSISVMEVVPNPTGYLWIPDNVTNTANNAALQLQRYYPDVCSDIREVRYCGGSISRADVDGLKRLFAQLPRARSLILEGVSGDFNRFDLLKGALEEIEHVTFKACVIYAEDLNAFLPGTSTRCSRHNGLNLYLPRLAPLGKNDCSPVYACRGRRE